jgi:hypothetical protein
MAERIADVKRGDQFRWQGVRIIVTRVAKDGTWADIVCAVGETHWRKRQRLPMPEGCERIVFVREVNHG